MRKMNYAEVAYEVISKFVDVDDVPHQTLRDIVNRSFSKFRHAGKAPKLILLFYFQCANFQKMLLQ